MYKVIQNNLYLTRGDTAVFPLKVTYRVQLRRGRQSPFYRQEKDNRRRSTFSKRNHQRDAVSHA